jgi:hypothetical protein
MTEVTSRKDHFNLLEEYMKRVKEVNPPCLRWDGLLYDSHDLEWKNNGWVCHWCNHEFLQVRKNGEQK